MPNSLLRKEEFPTNLCQGNRITVPIDYRNRLGLRWGDRLRVTIRKKTTEEEEQFLCNLCQGGRITVPLPYSESLGIKQGDSLRVKIRKDIPKTEAEGKQAKVEKECLVTSYDAEEDVLYINFTDPPKEATDSHKIGDAILRWNEDKLVGITILNISTHLEEKETEGQ